MGESGKIRRLAAVISLLCLLASLLTAPALAAGFQDVGPDAWYAGAVDYVSARGVMNGTSEDRFEPARSLSRAMMVQILYNLESRPGAGAAADFSDIPASAWYAEAVSWAASNGLVNGMGDGTFAPNDSITREQMVVILYRYTAAYQAWDLSVREELSSFGDGSAVSGYAREAVSWAVASDILHGKGNGTLAPRGTATRAEVAQLFANYLQASPAPGDGEFVRVREYIPDIQVELMYATDRNFTGQVIYAFEDAWLRYGTVKKLAAVQDSLRAQGLGLKIWDAFRPVSAQFRLWEIVPDARYVANPYGGYSSHSRGNTVDVTLVYSGGGELSMPTGFDDFTELADRDYSDVWDGNAVENALLLESVMTAAGFSPYDGEWWHFSDVDDYEAADWFEPPA